jgi:hypothetical protein
MTPKDFPQANCTLEAPLGMEDTVQPLRVLFDESQRSFTSIWMPSPEELAALNAGKGVIVTLYSIHPPLFVGAEGESLQLTATEGRA